VLTGADEPSATTAEERFMKATPQGHAISQKMAIAAGRSLSNSADPAVTNNGIAP
jgi:hypothetical protein